MLTARLTAAARISKQLEHPATFKNIPRNDSQGTTGRNGPTPGRPPFRKGLSQEYLPESLHYLHTTPIMSWRRCLLLRRPEFGRWERMLSGPHTTPPSRFPFASTFPTAIDQDRQCQGAPGTRHWDLSWPFQLSRSALDSASLGLGLLGFASVCPATQRHAYIMCSQPPLYFLRWTKHGCLGCDN